MRNLLDERAALPLRRRDVFRVAGGTGLGLLALASPFGRRSFLGAARASAQDAALATCTLAPEQTEGPYYVDDVLRHGHVPRAQAQAPEREHQHAGHEPPAALDRAQVAGHGPRHQRLGAPRQPSRQRGRVTAGEPLHRRPGPLGQQHPQQRRRAPDALPLRAKGREDGERGSSAPRQRRDDHPGIHARSATDADPTAGTQDRIHHRRDEATLAGEKPARARETDERHGTPPERKE